MNKSFIINKIYREILISNNTPKSLLDGALSWQTPVKDAYGFGFGIGTTAWSDMDVRFFAFLYKYGNEELNKIILR